MSSVEDTEREVLRVDAERNEALLRSDVEVLDRVWADDLTLTNSRGEVHGKAQRIATIHAVELAFRSYVDDDVTVRVYNATAVLTCRSTATYQEKGEHISHRTRMTRVYVKRKGRWQLVAQQATVIKGS